MAAYRRVYDSRHLPADCQEPGSASNPMLGNRVWATFAFLLCVLAVSSVANQRLWELSFKKAKCNGKRPQIAKISLSQWKLVSRNQMFVLEFFGKLINSRVCSCKVKMSLKIAVTVTS